MNTSHPNRFTMAFDEIEPRHLGLVGGKGANLAALSRLEDVCVPGGFCVTTQAFTRTLSEDPSLEERFARLEASAPDDREAIGPLSAEIRASIEALTIPEGVVAAVTTALAELGGRAYAVRSSATAEDLPTASFAGQHDSSLNVVGTTAVLDGVRRCWASLFTERAVSYRLRQGIAGSSARMAVVVQKMIDADASGVVFTADPVTANRTIAAVEAVLGLGEALVSGRVGADVHRVRDDAILSRAIATKPLALRASPAGGTRDEALEPEAQTRPAIADDQVVALVRLGRRIEASFGHPQDIEWCLADGRIQVVQSRPITTLFPIPVAPDDTRHVYISVGHPQMMTDAMKPLGLSFWQLTTRAPMRTAGGRLFVDVTAALCDPAARARLLGMVGRSDPLTGDALETIVERGDFLPLPAEPAPGAVPPAVPNDPLDADPAIVAELIADTEAALDTAERRIQNLSGPALFEFILADLDELKRRLFEPRLLAAVMASVEATWWLNDHLQEWLGEAGVADALAQSAPNHITAEMGRALLDVADAVRPYPDVVDLLERVESEDFLDELHGVTGGEAAHAKIAHFLDVYGMRCTGEIDITRPRWAERPSTLIPLILANVRNFEAGAAKRHFEAGQRRAEARERELLDRLGELPGGQDKVAATKAVIDRLRTFVGYREYPKHGMIAQYFIYKKALLQQADRLVAAGVLEERGDMDYLTFEELHEAARSGRIDRALIDARKREHVVNEGLTPPRVITSDGEIVTGAYRRDTVPLGALVGLAVSAGVVEGRARLVHDLAHADLEPGDILVTTHTDPSWSPLFLTAGGLVTEVGGLTSHGTVVAREYGLPAVVGVQDATRRIVDGQRIRVDGSRGYVELIADGSDASLATR